MRGKRVWSHLLFAGLLSLCLGPGQARRPGAASTQALLQATTYYVAPSGDDANPGTEARPWRTIQHAADTSVAGDTVYILAGTYRERVVPLNSGDVGHEITYVAYPGHAVTIDGSSIAVPEYSGLFDLSGRSYIRVSGLRVTNSNEAGILADGSSHIVLENNQTFNTASSGIAAWGSDHITIDGNRVELACYGGTQECITVAGTDTFEVRDNEVLDCRKEGIDAKDGASNGKIYRNHVHGIDRVGIYVDAWDKHTYNIEVYQNVVHDAANGFSVASEMGGILEHARVYNNVAYGNQYTGLWLSGCCPESAAHPVHDVQIVNNTFYGNGLETWGGGIGLDANPDVQDVLIRNNVCSDNLYFQIAIDAAIPMQEISVDHNLIDGYRGTEGEVYGDDYVQGDPLFADPAGADFHLQAGSPGIDSGSPTGAPGSDFDGHPRPVDGDADGTAAYDIGAYEAGWDPEFSVMLPFILNGG